MNTKFIFVVATQHSQNDFYKTPIGKSISKLSNFTYTIQEEIFFNNTKGLSTVYNDAIEKYKNISNNNDIMIFVHDDVYINDCFFFEKLIDAIKNNDVIGVAGSGYFSIINIPNTWHNSPKEYWSGFVVHPKEDKNESHLYCTNFGYSPKKVICLDGLFIACKMKIFNNPSIKFDEQFTFDMYDLDFCLNCYTNGLILTTYPICLTHLSHGKGILSERYKKLNELFQLKWNKKQANQA